MTDMVVKDTDDGIRRQINLAQQSSEIVPEHLNRVVESDLQRFRDLLDWSQDDRELKRAQMQLEAVSEVVGRMADKLQSNLSYERLLAELELKRCRGKIGDAFSSIHPDEDKDVLGKQIDEAIQGMIDAAQTGQPLTRTEEVSARKLLDLHGDGKLYTVAGPKGGFNKLVLN